MANRTPGGGGALGQGLREARGSMRQVDAAAASGISQPTITRFENGQQVPRTDQVETLCDAYAGHHPVAPALRRQLVALSKEMRAGAYRVVLRNWAAVQRMVGRYEAAASVISGFTPIGVHGLMQEPHVVRALFRDPAGAEERLNNQAVLTDPNRRFRYLMTEGGFGYAMPRTTGAMMAAQMNHLAELSTRPNIEIGIIPWGRPTPILPVHSWETYDEQAVCFGTTSGMAVITERADVAPYLTLWDQLAELSVYGDEARAILGHTAERYITS